MGKSLREKIDILIEMYKKENKEKEGVIWHNEKYTFLLIGRA